MEHITDEQKETVAKKIDAAVSFFEKVKADRAKKQLYDNPAFTCE